MGKTRIADGYDVQGGHISVRRGSMPLRGIDWSRLVSPPDETLSDTIGLHLLNGVETPRFHTPLEVYVMNGSLRLHVDDTLHPGMATVGIIIECEPDLMLSTGRSRVAAGPGDVFRLDPSRMHGTVTSGFLSFATLDYQPRDEPSPDDFAAMAKGELRRMLAHFSIPHQDVPDEGPGRI